MKTISLAVLESDYKAIQEAAKRQGRSAAQLIREAMAFYRAERLETRSRLKDLRIVQGHRPLWDPPARAEVYEEIFRA